RLALCVLTLHDALPCLPAPRTDRQRQHGAEVLAQGSILVYQQMVCDGMRPLCRSVYVDCPGLDQGLLAGPGDSDVVGGVRKRKGDRKSTRLNSSHVKIS